MPSRKQQRRRAKQRRHEWEEVYVDADGHELDPDEAEQLAAPAKATKNTKATRKKTDEPSKRGGRRAVEPPSWRRTLRRGLLFFPLMLIVVFFVNSKDASTLESVISTLTLMAFFLPFSYFMDSMIWRSYQRRLSKPPPARKR